MDTSRDPGVEKMRQAAALIKAGQRDRAHQLLKELLLTDENNLTAWEFLTRTTDDKAELTYSLKQILRIQPEHPWAGKDLELLETDVPLADAFPTEIKPAKNIIPQKKGTKILPPENKSEDTLKPDKKRTEILTLEIGSAGTTKAEPRTARNIPQQYKSTDILPPESRVENTPRPERKITDKIRPEKKSTEILTPESGSASSPKPERRITDKIKPESKDIGPSLPVNKSAEMLLPGVRIEDAPKPERKITDKIKPQNKSTDNYLPEKKNADIFPPESSNPVDLPPVGWGPAESEADLREELGLNAPTPPPSLPSSPTAASSPPLKKPSTRKRRNIPLILYFSGALGVLCVGLWGYYLFLLLTHSGTNSSLNLTQTANALQQTDCQVLIDEAMKAAGSSCDNLRGNSVCYGNFTIQSELVAGSTDSFSKRGDIISIQELQKLSASPLNLDNHQWGIAIFKVMANLPRSLPGENVTLMLFGNTTIDNQSPTLETFYFSSQLGKITCAKVPFDGIKIDVPEGAGEQFNINGTELTLMGNATLKANKGGSMDVSLYSGSGKIVANGQQQYFGAGQSVSVGLGGDNGMQAVTTPSAPVPLSQDDMNLACTLYGKFCSPSQITPVSVDQAQADIQAAFVATSTPTQTPSHTPLLSLTPTITLTASSTPTPSQTGTPTRTRTSTPTPTRTNTRTRTATPGPGTVIPSSTSTSSSTPTSTPTPSNTPTPSDTFTDTPTFTVTDTPTDTYTPTDSLTPSITPTPTAYAVIASPLQIGSGAQHDQLEVQITNPSSSDIVITDLHLVWDSALPTYELDFVELGFIVGSNSYIWDHNGNLYLTTSPSDIGVSGPTPWDSGIAARTIHAGDTMWLDFDFDPNNPALPSGSYYVKITFNTGDYIDSTIP